MNENKSIVLFSCYNCYYLNLRKRAYHCSSYPDCIQLFEVFYIGDLTKCLINKKYRKGNNIPMQNGKYHYITYSTSYQNGIRDVINIEEVEIKMHD